MARAGDRCEWASPAASAAAAAAARCACACASMVDMAEAWLRVDASRPG
jgi:hypothetical protein